MRIALLAALAACSMPAAAQLQPGEWEFTSTMISSMLPKPQTSTITQCISKAEAEDPARFAGRDQPKDCSMKPGEKTGDSFAWTVACPKIGMTGAGKARFAGRTLESEMTMSLEAQGQKLEMRSTTKGRHLGPCRTK